MEDQSQLTRNLQDKVEDLMEQDQAEAALAVLNKALEEHADDPRMRAAILDLRGTLYYNSDHYEYALNDFNQALTILEEETQDKILEGTIHSSIGATHYAIGKIPETVEQWELAMECYEANDPPMLIDVATIANNLGFLHKQNNDMDSAENCFLKALQILHSEVGQYDEQTATVFCNLGTLYHQAGFHDQALEMHETALNTRSKMLGRSHPDTAQSHNNMALTHMACGNYEEARTHFDQAFSSFAQLGVAYTEDFESVQHNYSELLHEMGEYEKAEEIEARKI